MENRRVGELIEEITDRFAALAEVDLTSLTGLEVLEHVQAPQRLRSLADAACVRAAGALDVSKAWAPEGANGRVATPGQLIPHLDKADAERIVFDGPSKVIDVGVRRRLFTGATRTAVLVTDRGCADPSCDTPMDRCQVDHITPWANGGLTIQDNGQTLCRFHNLRKGRQPPPDA
jgi:hypothetical protein